MTLTYLEYMRHRGVLEGRKRFEIDYQPQDERAYTKYDIFGTYLRASEILQPAI
jgi:hypothetical protein